MRKLSDREKVEQVFVAATEADARHLLDLAGCIIRARFPQKEPAKRTRRKLKEPEPPLLAVSK
jgi:hypothetical protein